jgi:hypothetical protein
LDGETERYRLVWAGQAVSVISPSFFFTARNDSLIQSMILKAILRPWLPGLYLLFFAAFLFALIRYSYRAKEFLACWLIFCSLFAALALISLGIVFACFAGHFLLKWLSVVKTVIPELVEALLQAPQAPVSGSQILSAASLNLPLAPYSPLIALDSAPSPLFEVAPLSEDNVRN